MLHVDEVLARIGPDDRVLDVGGWACPFNRADWVLDCEPYETRGYYATVGLPRSQGGDREHFSPSTWVRRDICDRTPWPFPDGYFDFSVCSHTLEDIRDPLFVCKELIRVSRRGYIETPSRLAETCRGWESDRTAGLNHHRWLIDYREDRLEFTMKWHMIHADRTFTLPPRLFQTLTPAESVSHLFWEGGFAASERIMHGRDKKARFFREFIAEVATQDRYRDLVADDPDDPEARLLGELDAARAELAELRTRLAHYDDLGPVALGLARRLRLASARFPSASALVKPIARRVGA